MTRAPTRPGERYDRRRTRRYALSFTSGFAPGVGDDFGIGPTPEGTLARLLAATAMGVAPGGPAPADSRALATLERVEEPDETATCAICLDDLKSETRPASRLPRCAHVFHEACLLPWLRDCHGTCPICRSPLAEPAPPRRGAWAAAADGGPGGTAAIEGGGPLESILGRADPGGAPLPPNMAAFSGSTWSAFADGATARWLSENATEAASASAEGGPHDATPAGPMGGRDSYDRAFLRSSRHERHALRRQGDALREARRSAAAHGHAPARTAGPLPMPSHAGPPYHPIGMGPGGGAAAAGAGGSDRPALARQRAALAAHYERHLARRSEREQVLQMPSDACRCLRMPTDAFDACGCLRTPADVCRRLRMPADACGCLRMPADACGCLRVPADACGCLRMPADAFGRLPMPSDAF